MKGAVSSTAAVSRMMPKLQQTCDKDVAIKLQREEKAVCPYEIQYDSGQRYRMYLREENPIVSITDARCRHVTLHDFIGSTSERFHNNE